MAICASVDPVTSAITATGTPVGECMSLVVLEPHEWVVYSIWTMPTAEEIASAWSAGFTIPMICFVIAWGIGRLVNFPR